MFMYEIQLQYVIRGKIQSETNSVRDKIQSGINSVLDKIQEIFSDKNSQIFSETEFSLRLNLSRISSALF